MSRALLVLEDGTVWPGAPFGARGEAGGEVVFTTAMTGYQEILTDPSYRGQIVVMTTAHVGNTGVNPLDSESHRPWLAGYAVRHAPQRPSSWRAREDLQGWLERYGIVGIQGLDTRALVRHIRSRGAMRGILSNADPDPLDLREKARRIPPITGRDLVREVTCAEEETWHAGLDDPLPGGEAPPPPDRKVVAFDFGVKHRILRLLRHYGFEVLRVPAHTPAHRVLARKPHGVFLSNGPGDPAAVGYAVETVRELLGRVPLFGICLGHQLLALACGARTYKLKFGHRGANQPVRRLADGRIEITTQNHGFAVEEEGLPDDLEVTHVNLNDHTVEGIRHRRHPAFAVQYHPEASPGPHDACHLFAEFRRMVERHA